MKKLLLILLASVAFACGDGRDNNAYRSDDTEAAAEEDTEIGSGEAISPQLELDSADNRFEVDTISSADETRRDADGGSR